MITREATIEDWEKLSLFFAKIYRKNHPLLNKKFWKWQYGDVNFGRSFICINENNEVVGHVGANFQGGIAWIINVYLKEECRGKGILGKLYALARSYYPLAATAANQAGLNLYRNMRWIRYHNLVRYVIINPNFNDKKTFRDLCVPIDVSVNDLIKKNTHYFRQPSLKGIELKNGSIGVSQENVGGLRVVDFKNLNELEKEAWSLGYLWMDYITSWNDLKIKDLEKNKWVLDYKSLIPWHLNPVEENYFCNITFLSEKPLNNEFVVLRNYSDHGRIGSL